MARELKYSSHGIDFNRLREELSATGGSAKEDRAEEPVEELPNR
ncbi:DUF3073 family protein [Streptosporangium algeriense]|uniref:DUF3073 family protein n=1 Tax=Streptosporangium algeriense TaxID=1682748 RepID=A0ABW3DPV6_9ACTN